MKFAICNETFLDWPLERALRFAAECGYTGIEFAPFTLGPSAGEISPARRAEVARLARGAGLETVGLHWLLARTQGLHLTSPDASVRRRTADYLADLARLCRDLDGSILVLGSPQQRNLAPGISSADGMRYAAEVIQAALPALEATNVVLAIEPLGPAEGDFLLTAAEGTRLVEMVGSPHCRLHLDCKAMSSEATPSTDLIRRHREQLVHFHANDPNRQGPGFGELKFEPILSALEETGYRGWVSVEVFDYSPGVEQLARRSVEYLRACLARIAQT
ncbi:MAG TPA: sugar phosphate isomerase/epimerase family protein [Pirellulales bacterium]|jgi:sugar phosphate isomerase/epimerase|nr:sugar phosphate isomerase/epimerase family protein [Pirellulales bacterium]